MSTLTPIYWPSARHFAEAIQCPAICFFDPELRHTLPAIDRLGMPLVTSGQFAYVYKLKSPNGGGTFAVRCFRGHLGDREQRYRAIDEHLQSHSIPALASFTYDSGGILVGGRKFPILIMEWIEGPTLDVYLNEMISRREVLLHLADSWLKLMSALREAEVAHGDLQHGNIIVERGQLRLVDLDGMFVPGMTGWTASEVGHQHYQHPLRDAQLFDARLDNFSSLVIYLSLISLAERPQLWAEHHDENLLFTRADFLDPASSALFSRIKAIGSEHRKLAEILETAAKSEPHETPCLLDLASAKSRLPAWMVAPPDIAVVGKTREAERIEVPQTDAADPVWTPWQAKRARTIPATPGSSSFQSIFSGPAPARKLTLSAVLNTPINWQLSKAALKHATTLPKGRRDLFWWYIGLYSIFHVFGMPFGFALFLIVVVLTSLCCLTYGFMRAISESQAAVSSIPPASGPIAFSLPPTSSGHLPGWISGGAHNPKPAPAGASTAIIGNRVLGIYHLHGCEWADRIRPKNRVGFASPQEAQRAGYRRCHVCSP